MLFAHNHTMNKALSMLQKILFMNNHQNQKTKEKKTKQIFDDWRKKEDLGNKMWLSFEKADLARVFIYLMQPSFCDDNKMNVAFHLSLFSLLIYSHTFMMVDYDTISS